MLRSRSTGKLITLKREAATSNGYPDPSDADSKVTKVNGEPDTEVKIDGEPDTEVKIDGEPDTAVKVDGEPDTAVKVDGEPDTEVKVDGEPDTEVKVDGELDTEVKVDAANHRNETSMDTAAGETSSVIGQAGSESKADNDVEMVEASEVLNLCVKKSRDQDVPVSTPVVVDNNAASTYDISMDKDSDFPMDLSTGSQ
jgi:hypothetical protein